MTAVRPGARVAHRANALAATLAAALAAAAVLWPAAQAQVAAGSEAAGPGIYTCIDDKGRKLTSDRPIPDCHAREQRVLNRDGSLRSVKPPPLTADERAEREGAERKITAARATHNDAVRRDRNLVARYPNETMHRKSREDALNTVRAAIKASETRVAELSVERKPLEAEAEFYKGKPLPMKLKQQFDANDAAVDAQKSSAQNQSAELVRINGLYDIELERLKRLWAGAQPGSLGPAAASAAMPAAAMPAATPKVAIRPGASSAAR